MMESLHAKDIIFRVSLQHRVAFSLSVLSLGGLAALGDTTPCRMTGVTLYSRVVSPDSLPLSLSINAESVLVPGRWGSTSSTRPRRTWLS